MGFSFKKRIIMPPIKNASSTGIKELKIRALT
jgi:hypothetical protein